MPGSSLWLLLPSNHPLQPVFETLIKKTSAHFNSPHLFIPHVTLTSNIDPSSYEPNPQKWINDLEFPASQDVVVRFQNLQSEYIFVKKLYVQVEKPGLEKLARIARTAVSGYGDLETAKTWVDREYRPHLSLL
jgi:2',3'-cyclic-nucleotide 3'-phosphodiesterase